LSINTQAKIAETFAKKRYIIELQEAPENDFYSMQEYNQRRILVDEATSESWEFISEIF
jgi:hypothetical protein